MTNSIECTLPNLFTIGNITGSVSSARVGGGVAAAIVVMLVIGALLGTVFILCVKTRKIHS